MQIRIKNLQLRTTLGVKDWERNVLQDVVINVTMECDISLAAETDQLQDTVDYQTLKKRILVEVQNARYFLLERLAGRILQIVMDEPKVQSAVVEVDKPHALRFADSVSVSCSAKR